MDDYDEVITDNPFYKAFQNKAKSLYNLAAEKRWLVSNLFFFAASLVSIWCIFLLAWYHQMLHSSDLFFSVFICCMV